MRKRTVAFALIVILAISIASSLTVYYQFSYLPQKQSGTSQESAGKVAEQNETSPQPTGGSTLEPNIVAGGPPIFATLTFSNETGFTMTIHPTTGTTEFVLPPNSVGKFTVTYTGFANNNLTISIFNPVENPVDAMNVNLTNGTLGSGSGLSVTESGVSWVSYYQVTVNYTVTSGASNGLYVLGLPSTFLNTIVDVGTQPYTGPLTWLNGTFN
jgi:hypothetical protein